MIVLLDGGAELEGDCTGVLGVDGDEDQILLVVP